MANVTVTDKAALEVKRIMSEQELDFDVTYLRVRVCGGGCSGFQHKLDLDQTVNENIDETYDVNNVKVVIDKRSALYLDGAIVDFHDDLNKRGFIVNNPSARTTCGCGSSVSF